MSLPIVSLFTSLDIRFQSDMIIWVPIPEVMTLLEKQTFGNMAHPTYVVTGTFFTMVSTVIWSTLTRIIDITCRIN